MTTAFNGRLIVIKKATNTSPATFNTITAMKDATVKLNNNVVDITNKDSSGFQELMDGKSMVKLTVSGNGVFTDTQVISDIQADLLSGALNNYTIDVANTAATVAGVQYACACKVVGFDLTGTHDSAITYALTLESHGTITAT